MIEDLFFGMLNVIFIYSYAEAGADTCIVAEMKNVRLCDGESPTIKLGTGSRSIKIIVAVWLSVSWWKEDSKDMELYW